MCDTHVEDGAADLEKVLYNIFLVTSEVFQIGFDEKVLLGLFKESIKLFVLNLGVLVRIKEMESLNNINEVRFTGQVLAHEEGILILLVEFSDFSSAGLALDSLRSCVLDIWGEESISILSNLLGKETVLFRKRVISISS